MTAARNLIVFLLLSLPGLPAVPEARAAETAASAVQLEEGAGVCTLTVPVGSSWSIQPDAGDLALELPSGAPASVPEGQGVCKGSVDLAGKRLALHIGVGRIQQIEQVGGTLRILFLPNPTPEHAWQDAYRLGVDDKLTVAVFKPVQIGPSEVVVDKDGTITFTGAGAVRVAGLTPSEAAARLRDLIDRNYLVDPEVSVIVKEYASQFVFVGGQVRTPGKQPLRGGTTLKEVLAEAGGFTENAGEEVVVTRELRVGEEPERVVLARREVERERADLALRPGDTITVSERKFFFITGQVMHANKYPWEDGVTLLQAISMAGGLGEWANKKDVRLLRTAEGKIETLSLDLRDIEKGKAADVAVRPGDTIIVSRRLL